MASLESKTFETPDERRTPPRAELAIVKFGDNTVTRVTYYPGFRWTTDVKPVAGTNLCQVTHFAYCLSGHLIVQMADGTQRQIGPGDIGIIPAGHDAWVVGDEPCVSLDFGGIQHPPM